jgi:cytochrome c-type biogenesis protein CcmI
MTEQLVLISIGLVVAVVILWPLFRGRGRMEPDRQQDLSPAASEQLAELDLDREMGRVSEEDYVRFRDELEATAPAAEMEMELPVTRDESLQRAEALVRRWKQAPRASCPSCGVRPEPEAAFCSNCGARLGA